MYKRNVYRNLLHQRSVFGDELRTFHRAMHCAYIKAAQESNSQQQKKNELVSRALLTKLQEQKIAFEWSGVICIYVWIATRVRYLSLKCGISYQKCNSVYHLYAGIDVSPKYFHISPQQSTRSSHLVFINKRFLSECMRLSIPILVYALQYKIRAHNELILSWAMLQCNVMSPDGEQ